MAAWEGKKYKLKKSENFDLYLKEFGFNFYIRSIAKTLSMSVSLLKEGDIFTLLTESTFKNTTIKFKLGEEFDEETMDGRKVKSVITLDSNTLIHEQTGTPSAKNVRVFSEKSMTATMTINGVVCTREYEVVK